jgi:hypothetical protein
VLGALLFLGFLGREDAPPPAAVPAPLAAAPTPSAPLPVEPVAPLPPVEPVEPPASVDPETARRVAIRTWLEASITEQLPELKLSSDELDAATDALMRLRAARRELTALPRTPETGERIRELTHAIGAAYADFEYVVELDPADFTELLEEDDE